jgi:signal transduction histidine kinase
MLGPLKEMLTSAAVSLSVNREAVELVYRSCLRLLKLVNALLDFSRIGAGRISANYEATDLTSFTSDLASMFRSAIEKAGLRFSVDCARLKQSVYVDREMWEKIVLNLISNAFEFTFKGEIAVSLLRTVSEYAEVSVSDTE